MRVCFGTLCFSSRLNRNSAADEEAVHRPPPVQSSVNGGCAINKMADLEELQAQLAEKDSTIADLRRRLAAVDLELMREQRVRELQLALDRRDRDLLNLRSQLDKFQSVFRVHNPASPKRAAVGAAGGRPRKQRAGISAEPQSEATLLELSKQTFETMKTRQQNMLNYREDIQCSI
ncbi:unnamed protein product [Phaedon cochleariae]|uniref:Uncharacterized protein n=1 Tax=Phaedon cochleariae TaxID=80249 RepID=A0A9N9S766_PHACE|nr:unnamed protein product [Phaedon cochleariae]